MAGSKKKKDADAHLRKKASQNSLASISRQAEKEQQEENEKPRSAPESPAKGKQPPPDSDRNNRIRVMCIAAFWAVVIFLGLPVWLWTTSIHRARLPLEEMMEWADGRACRPAFPLHIVLNAPSIQKSEAEHLVQTTQHALDDLNEFSAHHLRLTLGASLDDGTDVGTGKAAKEPHASGNVELEDEEDVALTVQLVAAKTSTVSTELQPYSSVMNVLYGANQVPSTSSSSSVLATTIANKLQGFFAEEKAAISYTIMQSPGSSSNYLGQTQNAASGMPRSLSPELAETLSRRATRSFKYAPTYHITFSLFTPNDAPSSWDIEAAVEENFAPLLQSITTSNFTVNTQVQLYAGFSRTVQEPEFDDKHKTYTLRNDDLSGFINAAEWPLAPDIGSGPTLNFVLYVPDPKNSPLAVKDSFSTSWLIPQWGGVAILNPPYTGKKKDATVPQTLSKEVISPAFLTFSHQLMALLGAPDSPPSFPLQIQSLRRQQTVALLLSASSTLGSLARLTAAMPSIPIPENVALDVAAVLSDLRGACDGLRAGRFAGALERAREAEARAEAAFFEKSMVGQVYFPDEHKVAVYLPLLGPVGVPLVMSAIKELKRIRAGR